MHEVFLQRGSSATQAQHRLIRARQTERAPLFEIGAANYSISGPQPLNMTDLIRFVTDLLENLRQEHNSLQNNAQNWGLKMGLISVPFLNPHFYYKTGEKVAFLTKNATFERGRCHI